jgi:hypothetical protein
MHSRQVDFPSERPAARHLIASTTDLPPPAIAQHAPSPCRKRQAVIGAGAAGLATARELRAEGHSVVVFEQGARLGGVWVYSEAADSDPLGRDAARTRVHSSLYRFARVPPGAAAEVIWHVMAWQASASYMGTQLEPLLGGVAIVRGRTHTVA